ncbi:hypothetical protein [Anaerocolumna chitinilytica]|uniref:Uncharacterized protein n=1 Tax=Anaerocolumna chitinilytica TaxID=1727145 RepID=A0A7M3SA22_9FIRM|nr:hypothetical protein [Anaerocolumna chitinilytica]BCK01440.1 hypothetical protein bsdcttw_44800 [Anaerocolumna chitinilytica]
MTLKEFAKGKDLLSSYIRDLEEASIKVKKREDFIDSLVKQGDRNEAISNYLWGAMETGAITKEEMDTMHEELMQIEKGTNV